MSEQVTAARISGRSTVVAAVIGGVFLVAAAFITTSRDDPPPDRQEPAKLTITDVEPIPQPANKWLSIDWGSLINEPQGETKTGNEISTFRVTLWNGNDYPLSIDKVEFVPTRIVWPLEQAPNRRLSSTLAIFPEIDHQGHIAIPSDGLFDDEPVSRNLDLTVEPRQSRTVVLWFQVSLPATASPEKIVDVHGILQFISESRLLVEKQLTVELRPEPRSPAKE